MAPFWRHWKVLLSTILVVCNFLWKLKRLHRKYQACQRAKWMIKQKQCEAMLTTPTFKSTSRLSIGVTKQSDASVLRYFAIKPAHYFHPPVLHHVLYTLPHLTILLTSDMHRKSFGKYFVARFVFTALWLKLRAWRLLLCWVQLQVYSTPMLSTAISLLHPLLSTAIGLLHPMLSTAINLLHPMLSTAISLLHPMLRTAISLLHPMLSTAIDLLHPMLSTAVSLVHPHAEYSYKSTTPPCCVQL